MKIGTAENTIRRSDNFEESKFKIAATGKAFKILSDNLYSNKIRAIIRELSCNAYDAHIAAGNSTTPFIVRLPSTYDTLFRIRDFGIGLSKEDILNIYTTYFESTKNHSNDMVGGLGLGSKTPFSYTDNFSVISYFEGYKYTFSCYISESGEPSCALLNTENTDQRNGLEISFAVRPADIHQFLDEARDIFSWFTLKPIIEGNKIKIEDSTFSGPWKDKNIDLRTPIPYALMGNVLYPIYLNNVPKLEQGCKNLIGAIAPIVFKFPIGALDVAPSREQLSYNDQTQAAIIKRLAEYEDFVIKETEKFVNQAKTPVEAVKLLVDNIPAGHLRTIFSTGKLTKDGVVLGERFNLDSTLPYYKFYQSYNHRTKKHITHCLSYSARRDLGIPYDASADKMVFVFADLDNFKSDTFRAWMRSITAEDPKWAAPYIYVLSEQECLPAFEKFGFEEGSVWYRIEDLPKPKSKGAGQKGAGFGRKKNEAKFLKNGAWSNYALVDLEKDEGFYVIRKGNQIIFSQKTYEGYYLSSVYSAVNAYQSLIGKTIQVAGLTSSQVKSVGPGWKSFETACQELMDEYMKNDLFWQRVKFYDENMGTERRSYANQYEQISFALAIYRVMKDEGLTIPNSYATLNSHAESLISKGIGEISKVSSTILDLEKIYDYILSKNFFNIRKSMKAQAKSLDLDSELLALKQASSACIKESVLIETVFLNTRHFFHAWDIWSPEDDLDLNLEKLKEQSYYKLIVELANYVSNK